jgi:hypothetical protein
VKQLLRPLLGEPIALEISTIDPSWMIQIDPGQFEQLLVNLAVNARDAMPDGGTLSIITDNVILDEQFHAHHPEVMPGAYLQIIVQDTGIGVEHSAREHVFEPVWVSPPATASSDRTADTSDSSVSPARARPSRSTCLAPMARGRYPSPLPDSNPSNTERKRSY